LYNTIKNIEFSRNLLSWFNKNKRQLPWRKTKDPYKIWLSEVMLQQTQVETVIPYYVKWVKRFPSIHHVANSKSDSLLKYWEGLGYYRRCINFHQSCKIIVSEGNGKFPDELEQFLKLPGVGIYTASAVLSISYNYPIPLIDANVNRVISRFLAKDNIVLGDKNLFLSFLNKIISKTQPGTFNEGLMELGSQICKNTNPLCNDCPINYNCKSNQMGIQSLFPKRIKKKKKPLIKVVTGIIWNKDKFYIQKRLNKKHLSNLWEFPGSKLKSNENLKVALKRGVMKDAGTNIIIKNKIKTIKHDYSSFSIELTLFNCIIDGIIDNHNCDYNFIKPSEINLYAFPKANHKLFDYIKKNGWKKLIKDF